MTRVKAKRIRAGLLLGVLLAATPQVAGAQASPSAFTSATRYDAAGRVTGTIAPPASPGPAGHLATRTTYNPDGTVQRVEAGFLTTWPGDVAPAQWTSFIRQSYVEHSYDALGRKVTERTLGEDNQPYALTQYSYDAAGRLECTAVRMNPAAYGSLPPSACTLGTPGPGGPDRITRQIYDAAGQLLQVRKAVGTSVEIADVTYTYTPNGKIGTVTDANGNRAELRYDGHDRQSHWFFPSPATPGQVNYGDYEQYGYDANGNRTSLRKRDGSVLTYQYDALNRMTLKVVPERSGLSATHTRDVYYGYDLRGLQTYARFDGPSGEGLSWSHDGFGRQSTETLTMDGVSRTATSSWDANSNRTYLYYPDGNRITYYRDGLDRLYYADLNGGDPLFHPPYDAAGRVDVLYRWRTGYGWYHYTDHSYDLASRPSGHLSAFANGSYNNQVTFARNAASQITTRTQSNDLYSWTGQVDTDRSYATNGLNQYTAAGGASFAYDGNGNLTSDGTASYVYDVENRMVAKTGGGSNAYLRYDTLGRLYELNGTTEGLVRFLHDGDTIIAEYNGAGALLRRYTHGTEAGDDPLVWWEGGSVATAAKRYLFADERGSIVAVTDELGTVTQVNAYDEYGIGPASAGDVSTRGRFRYTGQAWLGDAGLYYYKARMYSPTLGRFMQTDPIGYEDQINLYAYVANDPVNGTDFSGKRADEEYKVGPVSVKYNDSGITLKVDAQQVKFEATAGERGAEVKGEVFNLRGEAKAGTSGASVTAGSEKADVTLKADRDGASASARAGSTSMTATADRSGAKLEARTIQPDKVPAEFRGREGAERARTGTPAPRTFGQKVIEGLRTVMSLFDFGNE